MVSRADSPGDPNITRSSDWRRDAVKPAPPRLPLAGTRQLSICDWRGNRSITETSRTPWMVDRGVRHKQWGKNSDNWDKFVLNLTCQVVFPGLALTCCVHIHEMSILIPMYVTIYILCALNILCKIYVQSANKTQVAIADQLCSTNITRHDTLNNVHFHIMTCFPMTINKQFLEGYIF